MPSLSELKKWGSVKAGAIKSTLKDLKKSIFSDKTTETDELTDLPTIKMEWDLPGFQALRALYLEFNVINSSKTAQEFVKKAVIALPGRDLKSVLDILQQKQKDVKGAEKPTKEEQMEIDIILSCRAALASNEAMINNDHEARALKTAFEKECVRLLCSDYPGGAVQGAESEVKNDLPGVRGCFRAALRYMELTGKISEANLGMIFEAQDNISLTNFLISFEKGKPAFNDKNRGLYVSVVEDILKKRETKKPQPEELTGARTKLRQYLESETPALQSTPQEPPQQTRKMSSGSWR